MAIIKCNFLKKEVISIKVYALVGSSGTGKSYKVLNIAKFKNIEYIIDDGILISKGKKLGGFSAKKETTKLAAVKRAIFFREENREEMKKLIKSEKPKSILIIGTSNKMVKQIADNLELGDIDYIYQIEDVSSEEEIKKAKDARLKEGKHIIPLPTVELKKDFSGYFMDKLRTFIRGHNKKTEIEEKTIIRPTFSYIGKYSISAKAIYQIMAFSLYGNPFVYQFIKGKIEENNEDDGVTLNVDIIITNIENVVIIAKEVQKIVKQNIEEITGLHVNSINVNIKNINIL